MRRAISIAPERIMAPNGVMLKSPAQAVVKLLTECIDKQTSQHPNCPAVSAWDGYFTYSELDQLSSRLAAHLTLLGNGPETIIPVLFEKSVWAIVAMLAVVKAGAAFVALDVTYPDERLYEILQQTEAKTMLTSQSQKHRFTLDGLLTLVVSSEELSTPLLQTNAKQVLSRIVASPYNMLYIIFTSGSTGKPKGIVVENAAFVASAMAHGAAEHFNEKSKVLQFASFAFDTSLQEIFTTLIFGGCICIPSEDERRGGIADFINRFGVNLACFTPSYAEILNPSSLPSLRTVILGGEPVSKDLARTWGQHVELLIDYGPAEATIISSVAQVSDTQKGIDKLLGRPVGCSMWIVKEENHDELAADGQIGELLIEGHILARGYFKDEEKTATAFIDGPVWASTLPDGVKRRFYKTGDLVQQLPDGNLVFVARKDTQVKINGIRWELGELEARLIKAFSSEWRICVEQVSLQQGQSVLVVFVARTTSLSSLPPRILWPEEAEALKAASSVTTALHKVLPAAVIPKHYIAVDSLPLTKSAKIDRSALRHLVTNLLPNEFQQCHTSDRPDSNGVRVMSDKESMIRDLWAKVLSQDPRKIGLDDNFIHSGGDSLASIKLVTIARVRGLTLTVPMILSNPRLRDLARVISEPTDHEDHVEPFSLLGDSTTAQALRMAAATVCQVEADLIEDVYPASMVQMHLIGATLSDPRAYVDQHVFLLPSDLDFGRLHAALDWVTESAETLRTRIVPSIDREDQRLFQAVLRKMLPIELGFADDLHKYLQEDRQVPITIGSPLSRFAVIRSGDVYNALVWTFHHAMYDGHSLNLLLEAIDGHYRGSKPQPFTPLTQSLKDPSPEQYNKSRKFWSSYVAKAKWAQFPAVLPTEQLTPSIAKVMLDIKRQPITERGILMTTIIRTAFAMALLPYTEDPESVLYMEILSGRNSPVAGIDRVAGPTIGISPTRLLLSRSAKTAEVLATAQAQCIERIQDHMLPLYHMREFWGDFRPRSLLAIVDSTMDFKGNDLFCCAGAEFEVEEPVEAPMKLECAVASDVLELKISYDQNVIRGEEVDTFVADFQHYVQRLCSDNGTTLFGDLIS